MNDNNWIDKAIKCNKCWKPVSEMCYRLYKNNTMHLLAHCEDCGWRNLPFVPDLNIKTYTTREIKQLRKERKKEAKRVKNQLTLF